MNKSHDFRAIEREYVTSGLSLRELLRRHGITAHSLVTVQAKKHKRQEKREQYQAKESEAYLSRHAARHADREAEVRDKVLDPVDEALDRFREDMRATELVRQPDGSTHEEPVMRLKPKDVAILLDRLKILFERPARISDGRDLGARSELPIDALNEFVELTRGRAAPPASPLPRTRRLDAGGSTRSECVLRASGTRRVLYFLQATDLFESHQVGRDRVDVPLPCLQLREELEDRVQGSVLVSWQAVTGVDGGRADGVS